MKVFKRSRWPPCPYMVKTLKNLLWNQGRWPWNLVCSIRCSSTTKFVQMMTLGWPWPILRQGQRTYCNFVLQCTYGKGNFRRWMHVQIYYPKVLSRHLVFIIYQRHEQSHNYVCISREANMSVDHTTGRFSIIQYMHTKIVVKIFVCLPKVFCPRQHNKCCVEPVSEPTHTVLGQA